MENSGKRLEEMQQTVDEVKDIMHHNLNRVEERSEKLGDLDTRAELLRTQSKRFSRTAVKVKKKKRWENQKMKILLGAVVLVLVLIAIIVIAVMSSGNSSPKESEAKATQAPNEPVTGG